MGSTVRTVRRQVNCLGIGLLGVFLGGIGICNLCAQVTLETSGFGLRLGNTGVVESIFSNPGGDVIAEGSGKGNAFFWIRQSGKTYAPTALTLSGERLCAVFGGAQAEAVLAVSTIDSALHLRVVSVTGKDITELTFADLTLPSSAVATGWGVSVAALNEFTKGTGHPGMMSSGRATAFSRFGFERGDAAVIVATREPMRECLKQVVESAPAIPKSSIGGPYAVEAPDAYGSYLFAGSNVTEDTVGGIIELADRVGLNQLNLHAVRYGDWEPYPKQYPEGRTSLKRVVATIHAAGMLAGIHTYSEFISKSSPYVTPVPDHRLGTDAQFTLATALTRENPRVEVTETTEDMSATTGFFVRNSATIRIDDELIVYKGVTKEAPFAFTECTRGAYGTRASDHVAGVKVYHLRECFGLFVPDGESTLFTEVARNLAEMINECGFDMLYLDALDGSDAVAGREWSWHYAAKFTLEVFRHLDRPVLAEMSTFPHHLWYVRSRSGAWDHPTRSHKVFIDIHAEANRSLQKIYLPSHLGWWRYKTWHTFSQEPTYSDDIEHLGVRCLAWNSGVSIQGVDPGSLRSIPALTRLAAITRQYEVLRRARYFDDATCAMLRESGTEFALRQTPKGLWELHPSTYQRHKVTGADNGSQEWQIHNPYGEQRPFIRIQALHSVGSYDETADRVLAEFAEDGEFGDHRSIKAAEATLVSGTSPVKVGERSAVLTATNSGKPGAPCWARWTKTFDPPIDLTGRQAMGVWVHGDGKGEVLNLQLRSPVHMTYAYGEHYIKVDFDGWRYFELVEPDAEDYRNCTWPYRSWYAIYRTTIRYNAIRELTVYVNNVPAGETVTCALSPVRGLPLVEAPVVNPSVRIGDAVLNFPVSIPTGWYLEYDGETARLYDRKGQLSSLPVLEGERIRLVSGENRLEFACDARVDGLRSRAMVTVGLYGNTMSTRRRNSDIRWNEMSREIDPPRQILSFDGKQNEWHTICREAGKDSVLDFEMTVHRIETSASPYETDSAFVIDPFDDVATFADTVDNDYLQFVRSASRSGYATSEGVTHELTVDRRSKKFGKGSFCYSATSTHAGGWSARGRYFADALDLSAYTHTSDSGSRGTVSVRRSIFSCGTAREVILI